MRFIYLTIIWLIIDLYCFQAIKTSFENSNSYIKNIEPAVLIFLIIIPMFYHLTELLNFLVFPLLLLLLVEKNYHVRQKVNRNLFL